MSATPRDRAPARHAEARAAAAAPRPGSVVSVGVVGLGEAGFTLHLPALASIAGARIVGACDVDPQRRERAREKYGVATFDGFDRLLDERPDVVVIGTPPALHRDHCMRALDAGADVVCEKPFTSTVREADELIAFAAARARRIALNHEFREMPIFRALRAAVGRPAIGDLRTVHVWQLFDRPPGSESGWRGQLVHRTLYEAGVHLVDLLMVLFGERPRAVVANMSAGGTGQGDTDAVVHATLEFSQGRVGQISQNRVCRGERQYFEVRADCADASLRASFGGRARITGGLLRASRPHLRFEYGASGIAWLERGARRTVMARNGRLPVVQATREILVATLGAIRTGDALPVPAEFGRDVMAVIAACYHSAHTGRRVELEGAEPPEVLDRNMAAAPA